MRERLPDREAIEDPRAEVGTGSAPRTPRGVTALGIGVAILIVLTLVALHLVGALGPSVH